MHNVSYKDYELSGVVNSRLRLITRLLLHGPATRKELSGYMGISLPTVTNHAMDLLARGLLLSTSITVSGVKKPIQVLRPAASVGRCSAFSLSRGGIVAELLSFDGSVLDVGHFPAEPKQSSLLLALHKAFEFSAGIHCVIGVDGIVSPLQRSVFTLMGVPDWEACTPGDILENTPLFSYGVASRISAQVYGFAHFLKRDDNVGFISLSDGEFRIGAIVSGQQILGHLGTSGGDVHISVPGGRACYCMRKECFYAALKNGTSDPDFLAAGIRRIVEQSEIQHVGLDFGPRPALAEAVSARLPGLAETVDGEFLFHNGLRRIALESAWKSVLTDFYVSHKWRPNLTIGKEKKSSGE